MEHHDPIAVSAVLDDRGAFEPMLKRMAKVGAGDAFLYGIETGKLV
jgi:hypothetical protein